MKMYKFIILALVALLYSCGTGGGGLPDSVGGGGDDDTPGGTPIITLAAIPTGISFTETSILTATVTDSSGTPIADGTTVNFMLTPSSLGSLSASSALTSLGEASVTLTAGSTAGTVVATAAVGDDNAQASIVISSVSQLSLAVNPSTITVLGTATVTATVLDGLGALVPDGTSVSFAISPTSAGTITSQSPTVSGIATATFMANNVAGTVVVTVTSGTSNTINITVDPADTGSIQFSTAEPSLIGLRGSGQVEISTVTFIVRDINGNVVDNINVDFCLIGPSGGRVPADGGEYIGAADSIIEAFTDSNSNGCYDAGESYTDTDGDSNYTSPLHAVGSTANGGLAIVNLSSGEVAGNVTIIATVQNTSPAVSTATPVISIGGGIPNDIHLTVATDTFNLPGLAFIDKTATITTLVADRYGNANVLTGTTVSYFTESGATLTSSSNTNSEGRATVTFRTQSPDPADVTPLGWETTLQSDVLTEYGITATGHPRDGWATIVATVNGEEHFDDRNGNGLFDVATESFTDTPQEPFVDYDDNDTYSAGVDFGCPGSECREEYYRDENSSGTFDGVNATWDSSKTLFKNIKILITGSPYFLGFSSGGSPATTFTIADGGSQNFTILVSDYNLNHLSSGSEVVIVVEGTGAKVTGFTTYTFPDIFTTGPLELGITLSDTAPDDEVTTPNVVTLKVTVTWEGTDYIGFISGTVD